MTNGSTNRPYRRSRMRRARATQARPAACKASPADDQRPGPDPVGERPRPAARSSIGVAVHGSSRSPVAERPVTQAELEVLRGEEGGREDRPGRSGTPLTLAAEKARIRNSAQRQHRAPPRTAPAARTPRAAPARRPAPRSPTGRSSLALPARARPQARATAPPATSSMPGQVEPPGDAPASGSARRRDHGGDQADRHVDPEDPVPDRSPVPRRRPPAGRRRWPARRCRPRCPTTAPRREAGNALVRIVRLSGVTAAAPSPWTARAAISVSAVGASAHAAEARLNRASPAT